MSLFRPNRYPGKLIVVEGIDGSGKSTQLSLLNAWLRSQNRLVVPTEWNSSPLVAPTTRRAKKRHLLTPASFSLIQAADFADRIERRIVPVLKTGAVVLADRYAYTACARDVARGLSRKWARNLYSFAIRPNAVFYFRLLPEEALARLTAGRRVPGHYEAGMDIGLSRSIDESFRLFQGRVTAEYDAMAREDVFHIIDATLSVEEQQQELRQAVMSVLVEERRSHAASAAQVL